jgi:hypothetical protein
LAFIALELALLPGLSNREAFAQAFVQTYVMVIWPVDELLCFAQLTHGNEAQV